jgi:hypothetical protein
MSCKIVHFYAQETWIEQNIKDIFAIDECNTFCVFVPKVA